MNIPLMPITCIRNSFVSGISLYSSPRVIKSVRMRWAGHAARMGEGRGVYRVLVWRPEGKRPLRGPGCRREDNF